MYYVFCLTYLLNFKNYLIVELLKHMLCISCMFTERPPPSVEGPDQDLPPCRSHHDPGFHVRCPL